MMHAWIGILQQMTTVPMNFYFKTSNSLGKAMFHPLIPGLVYPLYLLIRAIIHFFRNIGWRLTGIHAALSSHVEKGGHTKCAHVLRIKCRFKFDVLIQSNKPEDFVLFHESFEYPEYVLKDEISLYHINATKAMFVECHKGCSVWDLTEFSFSKEAQFRLAKRVIILPTVTARKLAQRLKLLEEDVIFMGNMSRCGSTLLCRMFQSTGHFISYVEPGVLADLTPCVDYEDNPDVAEYITTTIKLLCKPYLQKPAIERHVIKMTTSNTKLIKCLHKLFPKAHYVFVYRNMLPVMKSLARIVPSLPYTHLYSLLNLLSTKWAADFCRYHSRCEDLSYLNEDFVSPYRKIIPICLPPVILYFSFVREGINICAVRYEDLIQHPEDSLKKFFSAFDIPYSYIPKALIPLDRDAQEKSSLSGTKLANLKIQEFTDYEKEYITQLCQCYGLPNILKEKVLPHTVTLSGKSTRR